MRDLYAALNQPHLVDRLDVRGETPVDAEDLALDKRTDAQVIEDIRAILPWVRVAILPDGLVIEPIDCGNLSGLMVASQQSDMRGVLQLQTEQQLEGFHGVVATVHEVAHEHVFGVRDLAAFVEKFQQVVELAMDVAANGDRR